MDRQSSSPGAGIGWAFGAAGFLATVLVGRLMSAGTGFVLFMLVLWVGLGALFAFLVERSTIEEQDRAEELHNPRLATLDPVRQPARGSADVAGPANDPRSAEEREAARRAADEFAAAVIAAVPLGAGTEPAGDRTTAADTVAARPGAGDTDAVTDPATPAADEAAAAEPAPADASSPDRDRRTRKVRGYRTPPAESAREDHAAA